ncbi:MAG: Holliday junction branch migration protein RuvA [Ruminococcaceae bacterium]|nr:Holliday junction branch migration protein RuvA [Oscillospiraceae bacterium]
MLYHVRGTLVLCESGLAVVECGGVGYALTISLNTAEKLAPSVGTEARLFTHLQVREDGVELFGFGDKEELSAFRLLISVSGVGPKAAMSILSQLTPDRFAYAVCTEDAKALSRANGIGAKTAARIVLELKDKISKDQLTGAPPAIPSAAPMPQAKSGKLSEAADALTVLGYSRAEVTETLRHIDTQSLTLEQIITAALKYFSEKA